ncbi:MAG: NADH-quinone oxidoreductase subunit M [Frankiaceae bacterium]|jgi:NADH-quinone oxidoreductase subunit M
MSDFPWLTVIGAVPLVGSLAVLAVPRRQAKPLALAVSLLTLALTIAMCASFEAGGPRFQFTQTYQWIPQFGVHYAVGVDGIALALIALSAILVPVVILASWHDAERPTRTGRHNAKTFMALVLALETTMIGVFAATDVFLFYVFFEAMLLPMYFLIGSYGVSDDQVKRSYAAVKFFLYSLVGGLLMLAAVIGLWVAGGKTFLFTDLVGNLDATRTLEGFLFLGFFIAFAIKAPLWPFHTWLPDAAAEAPIGAAVLLVGVLDKVGTYGFLRYCLPLFPNASKTFAPYILALCVIGILYGALVAIGQTDLKRLVAYTSVAHFGFIALGIFAFTTPGGSGAALYMVNHGFSTGALFLLVGFLITRRGSRRIDDFGGVQQVAPWLAGTFLIAGLSSLALPGLSSFVSEFLVLVGTFTRYRTFAVLATLGIVLAALYILVMYQRIMHGPVAPAVRDFRDLSSREAWVIAPMLALILALGVYPKPLLDVINPAVKATLHDSGRTDPKPSIFIPASTSEGARP